MDRRALIAGAVTLPLLPATGTAAQPANATDAAWAELEAADAAFDAAYAKWEAFHDWVRDQIGNEPVPFLDSDLREVHRQLLAWRKARAELPENPHQHPAEGEPRESLDAAREAVLRAPVVTMTDLERKLSLAYHVGHGDEELEVEFARTILEGVRAMIGRAT